MTIRKTGGNWVEYSPDIANWAVIKMTPNMWREWSVDLCDYINSEKCGRYSAYSSPKYVDDFLLFENSKDALMIMLRWA
jgi:hypothetical protein